MILNNYWTFAGFMLKDYNLFENRYDSIGVLDENGVNFAICLGVRTDYGSAQGAFYNHLARYNLKVKLGTGTTEPTAGDYCLENDVTSSISNYSTEFSTVGDGGSMRTVVTITGTNGTENPITITEIGILKTFYSNTYGTLDGRKSDALLIRHLLETPKTVASGDGFSLTFTWVEG